MIHVLTMSAIGMSTGGERLDEFRQRLIKLFDESCGVTALAAHGTVNVGALMSDMITLCREHYLELQDADFANVVVTIGVLEGIISQ